jgi:hypothetical protein
MRRSTKRFREKESSAHHFRFVSGLTRLTVDARMLEKPERRDVIRKDGRKGRKENYPAAASAS